MSSQATRRKMIVNRQAWATLLTQLPEAWTSEYGVIRSAIDGLYVIEGSRFTSIERIIVEFKRVDYTFADKRRSSWTLAHEVDLLLVDHTLCSIASLDMIGVIR